jgi:RimJ/RimL family protein N-acetyltransferase
LANDQAVGLPLVRALKSTAGGPGPALSIPVGHPVVALLRPVATLPDRLPASDVRLITLWRNRHRTAFLTEFTATIRRTGDWLSGTVGPDESRILFMLDDLEGRPFGHVGLAGIDWELGTAEIDSVVRGEPGARGAMSQSLHSLAAWASNALGIGALYLRVRSDNPAVAYYASIGFSERRRAGLRLELGANERRWVEDGPAGTSVEVIYMDYLRREHPGDPLTHQKATP